MEPRLQPAAQTVGQDLHGQVIRESAPELVELEPPDRRWHLPFGFASLLAAGALLLAAGAVQQRVHDRKHGARHQRTKIHKKRIRPSSAPLRS